MNIFIMNVELQINQLSYARNDRVLFHHLDIYLESGQGLLVYGPNGSGKTSLLRILAGLVIPLEGNIEWGGESIHCSRSSYHQAIHYLGHHNGVRSHLTVRENLSYGRELGGISATTSEEYALHRLQLDSYQNILAKQLSAGQKRRLALARLLISPKPIWILDEPFTNLDQNGQQLFSSLMEEHLQKQGIVIIASHQPLKLKQSTLFRTLDMSLATLHD